MSRLKAALAALGQLVSTLLADNRKRYADHLYYRHRTFDVKGFSTQGKFALELETVYVDLGVDPAVLGSIPQDPIRIAGDGDQKSPRDMFAWLQAEPPRNFAIVGPPGSGKTTLLKHLALGFAAGKAPLKLTPVLLFLREHAGAIGANPEVRLTDELHASLRDPSLKGPPPPAGWFEYRLRRGRCLVMLDGLDEVADPELRRKVVEWVEREVGIFGGNRFLVSSRPNGYRDNPLSGFTVLRVLPFNRDQVERFVRNWYLANELVAYQKDDPGVRMEADKGAKDLLARLRVSPTMQELAVNPLLLTLIATVHRYRSELPGRRVELYAEICEVFLGKRQAARGLELDMTPAQKIRVLRVLAYTMMCGGAREITAGQAASIISGTLKLVAPAAEPLKFLQTIEDSSALLVQKESGVYGFAHLTFQEYLASLHIKEEKLVEKLAAGVDQTWWHETARLYAAQADATPIVEKCLGGGMPSMQALLLATDCESEALELGADLRESLRRITEKAIEDPDPERRRLAAVFRLARRTLRMTRIDDDYYLDTSPVSHAEYQLFLDEMRLRSEYRQPDHWESYQFAPGTGISPVVGIRQEDAEAFCQWLSQRVTREWNYSLPAADVPVPDNARWRSLRFFTQGSTSDSKIVPAGEILERVRMDHVRILSASETDAGLSRSILRVLSFYYWLGRDRDLAPALDRACDFVSALDLDPNLALALDRALALNRALDRDRARALALGLARAFDRVRALNLYPNLALDQNLAPALDRGLARTRARARTRDLARAVYLLNWLCIVEGRIERNEPPVESLWLARVRKGSEGKAQSATSRANRLG